MGLLRKRTSKASLKAAKDKDEPRLITPPPQLPPLPAHIRRSESTTEKKQTAGQLGNRRRSRSLWGDAPPKLPNQSSVSLVRRDSLGSRRAAAPPPLPTSPEAQPWRSREAWAALHTPTKPAVLSDLTLPCAPGATPGWRGRGGGGFFGGDAEDMEKERMRAPSRSQSRADSRYDSERAPPLPMSPMMKSTSLYSPTPAPAKPLPTTTSMYSPAPTRKPPLPPSDPANAPTPELAKSPSPSPETAPSVRSIRSNGTGAYDAAAYAEAAGIASPSNSDFASAEDDAYTDSQQPMSRAPFAQSTPHANPLPAMTASPGLTSSPSLSAVSPHLPVTPRVAHSVPSNDTVSPSTTLLTPNSSAVTALADSQSTPWGAASRSPTPVLQRAGSSASVTSATLAVSTSSVTQTNSPGRSVSNRLPPPSYTRSEDDHTRPRPEKVEHFVDHRSSLPESNPQVKSRVVKNPSPIGESIDFTRPPTGENRAAPHPMLANAPPVSRGHNAPPVVGGYPSNTLSASSHNHGPTRTPSNASLNSSQSHASPANLARLPSDRDNATRQRTISRAEEQRAPSRTERAPSRAERPPSRSTSSQGHSTGEHIPYTPGAIANAVNAWRTKNGSGKKSTEELVLMAGQQPSSRARTPSGGHGPSAGVRSRTRSAASLYSNPHNGSTLGLSTRKVDKLEVAPEWPARDVDADPFAAAQHPWEAAYDVADYQDDPEFTESPEDTSSDTDETRAPIAHVSRQVFPVIDEMPPAGGELPPAIEPPVLSVAADNVMLAHAQMSQQLQKTAEIPQERQHYHRPQQERSESQTQGRVRKPSDAAYTGPMRLPMSPPAEQRVLSPQQEQRVLSPQMQQQRVLSPEHQHQRIPVQPPPDYSARPRPPQASSPPQLYPPPGSQPARHPQGQVGHAPIRLPMAGPPRPQPQQPQQARPYPPNAPQQHQQYQQPPQQRPPYPTQQGGPQRLPPASRETAPPQQARHAPFPGAPPQHVYRPTQSRPFQPAAGYQQQQFIQPRQHAQQMHYKQPSGDSNGHQMHYRQPSGDSSGHQHMHYKQPSGDSSAHHHFKQMSGDSNGHTYDQHVGYAPQYGAQYARPPQGQGRGQPPPPLRGTYKGMAAPISHPMPMSPPPHGAVHKSPRLQQGVSQGGWI